MDYQLLDDEFDCTRTLSALDAYGDEGAGYEGSLQRKALERKYDITPKSFEDVEHPVNRGEYAAAVRVYFPEMDDEAALRYLLDNTRYPFEHLQNAKLEVRSLWFDGLDKEPYLGDVERHFPGRAREELIRLLEGSGFTPAAGDLDEKLTALAARKAEGEARLRATNERVAAERIESQKKWDENAPAREARRLESRRRRALESRERAERKLEQANNLLKELDAEAAG